MNTSTLTYLNTASCGLVDEAVRLAGDSFTAALAVNGSGRSEEWWHPESTRIRDTIAYFLNTGAGNIAIIPNFSWALNAIVYSLDAKSKVMLYRNEYPSVLEPFRLRNFDIQWVDSADGFTLPVDEIKAAIQNMAIDILAISHVQYNSGYTLDIKEIGALCRKYGVLFIVDATQSMGCLQLDMSALEIDILIASNYKWMNAGFGTGILYMADEFLDTHKPAIGGNNGLMMIASGWQYNSTILSYEPGHPNIYGQLLLEAAINQKMQTGIATIEAHNLRLTGMLLEELKSTSVTLLGPHTMDNRTSIILLKDENGLYGWLKENNIVVTNRAGMVRISIHYHNTEEDIARLVAALKAKP
jgi:cysteine desulfurase / selenocysteine lyase